ncbi:hypothetical protein HDU86_002244 [Geranomyces michiganensis]|nr:hypothetical protein HDU86_002244 [Geranomyces michiganensis]
MATLRSSLVSRLAVPRHACPRSLGLAQTLRPQLAVARRAFASDSPSDSSPKPPSSSQPTSSGASSSPPTSAGKPRESSTSDALSALLSSVGSAPSRRSSPLTSSESSAAGSTSSLSPRSSLFDILKSRAPTETSGAATSSFLGSFAPRDEGAERRFAADNLAGRSPRGGSASWSRTPYSTDPLPQANQCFTLHIAANKNNTIATFTNAKGEILVTASAGNLKLKKAARGTSDAGYMTVAHLTEKALALPKEKKGNEGSKLYHSVDIHQEVTYNGVHLKFKGFGPGRDQAFRAVMAAGWKVLRVSDCTPVRHAGCRPRKKRRL